MLQKSIALMLLIACTTLATASEVPQKTRFGEGAKFFAGVLTGFVVHEAAHFAVLEAKNIEYDFDFPDEFTYQGSSDAVQYAGFAAQAISTELILLKKRRNNYLYGWLGWNIFNEIWYPARSWIRSHDEGDLGTDSMTTRERNQVSALLLGHAALTIYRLSGDDDFKSHFNFFFGDPTEGSGIAYSRTF